MMRVAPTLEDLQRYPVLGAIDEREEKVKVRAEVKAKNEPITIRSDILLDKEP